MDYQYHPGLPDPLVVKAYQKGLFLVPIPSMIT